MSINFGGLALAVLAGVIGSVSATSAAGHLSGPALSGAAVAGALTGALAFAIPPKHDASGGAQILGGVQDAAAVTGALPAQAQPAAVGVLTQVAAAAASVPAAATAAGPAPTSADFGAILARLDALLAQRVPPAPASAPGAVAFSDSPFSGCDAAEFGPA